MFSWESKNVLITGVTGFVGSSLFARLNNLGANVFGISRSAKNKNIFKIDVTNFSELNDFLKKKKIKICFHLAGEALVERGQKNPYGTFKTNIAGAFNILESSRLNDLERVIIASTAHVYGDNKVPFLEEFNLRPSRPYETSKSCADLIAQAYANTYDLPVVIPRFANIYGPGDTNYNRVIPKTIVSILKEKNPKMWGGGAKRQYLYIEDAISAYIKLAELEDGKISRNRVYNFGSGKPISVKELMKKIIKLSSKNIRIEPLAEERVNEVSSQYVSWKKAKINLFWKPMTNLDKGLLNTIDWYKRNINI